MTKNGTLQFCILMGLKFKRFHVIENFWSRTTEEYEYEKLFSICCRDNTAETSSFVCHYQRCSNGESRYGYVKFNGSFPGKCSSNVKRTFQFICHMNHMIWYKLYHITHILCPERFLVRCIFQAFSSSWLVRQCRLWRLWQQMEHESNSLEKRQLFNCLVFD